MVNHKGRPPARVCVRWPSGLGGGGRVPGSLTGPARACPPARHGFLGVRLEKLLAPRLLLATPKQATLERRVIPRPWQPDPAQQRAANDLCDARNFSGC